jgi:hypothetical protein
MNRPLKPRRYQGPFVYKYRSVEALERLKPILLENTLYFPMACQLNDPEEARPPLAAVSPEALSLVLAQLNVAAKPFLTNQGLEKDVTIIAFNVRLRGADLWLGMLESSLNKRLGRFRIYSLSTLPDNSHLWKKYAGNHTGYCLEFSNEESFGQVFEVRYDDIAIDITDPEQLEPYFLFYKRKSWRPEQEVRMIDRLNSEPNLTFDPRLLARLILGKRITPENEATIRTWARGRKPPLTIVSELDMAAAPHKV